MKIGYMEYDMTTEFETKIDSGDLIVVDSGCGIYNIIFKKQLLNDSGGICGDVYFHAPNCTMDKDGKYIAHGADEDRTTIAYHQLCDLAHVPRDTSCYDLFKALGDVVYPDGYKPNPNRAERRKKE